MSTTCLPNDGQTVGICPTNICSPQGVERAYLDQNEQEKTVAEERAQRIQVKGD